MPNPKRAAAMAARWRADRMASRWIAANRAPAAVIEPPPKPKGPSCVVCGKRASRAVDEDNGLCHRKGCSRKVMRYKPKGENQE